MGWGHQTDTWTPKVCKSMAFMAVIRGLGQLFFWGSDSVKQGGGEVFQFAAKGASSLLRGRGLAITVEGFGV